MNNNNGSPEEVMTNVLANGSASLNQLGPSVQELIDQLKELK